MAAKYPGISKVGPNRYRIRLTMVDPLTGRRKAIDRLVNAQDIREAAASAAQLQRVLRDDPVERPTVAVYAKRWLERRQPTLRRGTAIRYAEHLDRFISELGHVAMDRLTPAHVTAHLDKMVKAGLSGWTISGQLRVIRTMTKDAQAELRLPHWACERVRSPRPVKMWTEEEPNALEPEELSRLFDAMEKTQPGYFALFAFLAYTGTRWCEAHAAEWDDLDLEKGIFRVSRSHYRGEVGPPKTAGSRRVVPLVPELVAILKDHRAALIKEQHPGLEHGLVFPNSVGRYEDNPDFNHALHRAAKKAGITKKFSAHGLRRTMNTLALRVAPAEVVRSVLGHTTSAMTSHYLAAGTEERLRVVGGAVKLLRGAAATPSGGDRGGDAPQSGDGSPAIPQ